MGIAVTMPVLVKLARPAVSYQVTVSATVAMSTIALKTLEMSAIVLLSVKQEIVPELVTPAATIRVIPRIQGARRSVRVASAAAALIYQIPRRTLTERTPRLYITGVTAPVVLRPPQPRSAPYAILRKRALAIATALPRVTTGA